MHKDFSPTRLDVAAFAEQQSSLTGADDGLAALQKYERLAQDWQGLEPDAIAAISVHWQAQGSMQHGPGTTREVWLTLQAKAHLQQTCQRCLQAVGVPVEIERSYRFVADEATAERDDAEVEEDLLVTSRQFNLQDLVEDELLMELPLVALHEVCPVQLPTQAVSPGFEEPAVPSTAGADAPSLGSSGKPNPFAVLASLKLPPG